MSSEVADVLAALDPNRALRAEELERLYAERKSPIRGRLAQLLSVERSRVALWGQSGSGKSTEMVRLLSDLEKAHFPVLVQPGAIFDMSRLSTQELLALSARQAASRATGRGWTPSEGLVRRTPGWGVDWEGDEKNRRPMLNLSSIKSLTLGLAVQETNVAVREIENAVGRPVVMLIDGLEKLSLATAEAIFCTNSDVLAEWPARVIFVVPPLLVYGAQWNVAERHLTDTVFLPALAVGGPDSGEADRFFRDLATKRLGDRINALADPLFGRIVRNSGGIPRQFLQVLREAFVEASLDGLANPDDACLDRALVRIRNAFHLKLRPAQMKRLRELHSERPASVERSDYDLLAMSCLIQYQSGGRLWHDWNPVLEAAA